MDQNERVEIEQVGNGYIARPYRAESCFYTSGDVFVFQSHAELIIWLGSHFDHRCETVRGDTAAKVNKK